MYHPVPMTAKPHGEAMLDLLVFKVNEQLYGLPVTRIVRIIEMVTITHLPGSPETIEGIINLQGRIAPMMNLRRRFNLPFQPYGLHTPIILADLISSGHILGLVIDSVEYVLAVEADNLELTETIIPTPLVNQMDNRAAYLSGFAKVDRRIILILNVDALLTPAAQDQLVQALSKS